MMKGEIMEKIGKLTKKIEGGGRPETVSLNRPDGTIFCESMLHSEADAVIKWQTFHDFLTPPAGLERSGEPIDVGKCRSREWYWVVASGTWLLYYGDMVFVGILDGELLVNAVEWWSEIELPTKQ